MKTPYNISVSDGRTSAYMPKLLIPPRSKQASVVCPYCGNHAHLVNGRVMYPHRPELFEKQFWQCKPCDAYVGCHAPGHQGSDGTKPLGSLANKELRLARRQAHAIFDPFVRQKKWSRSQGYAWLSDQLGIKKEACHIAMFDEATCLRVMRLANCV